MPGQNGRQHQPASKQADQQPGAKRSSSRREARQPGASGAAAGRAQQASSELGANVADRTRTERKESSDLEAVWHPFYAQFLRD